MKVTSPYVSSVADTNYGVMPLYTQTSDAVEDILRELRTDDGASTESFANVVVGRVIGRMVVSLCDTFTGLLNTFVTNVTKFHKALKRSELKEFCQSNRMKVGVVSNSLCKAIGDVKVNAPAGMNTTFVQAIETLQAIYVQLNAVETARTMQAALQETFAKLSNQDSSVGKSILTNYNFIHAVIKNSKPAVLKCQKEFGSERAESVPITKAYADLSEVRKSIEMLLSMEPRLQDVHALVKMAQQMEAVVKGMVDLVKTKGVAELNIANRDLANLGETAKDLALVFDSYSLAATRQMTLEHNTVLNINALYKVMS